MTDDLVERLTEMARSAARQVSPDGGAEVLSRRNGVLVIRVGDVIAKAHRADTDAEALRTRLRVAATPEMRHIFVPPLADEPAVASAAPSETSAAPAAERAGERLVTLWPAGEAIKRGYTDKAPWEEAARLLARLHATPLDPSPGGTSLGTSPADPSCGGTPAAGRPLPQAGGPARVARAIARLDGLDHADAVLVRAAYAKLPAEIREPSETGTGETSLVHGDWHLGQLVRRPGPTGEWLLIDVDDLGTGDPAWDLARPAAFFAAGLLPPEEWVRFLDAYRAADGRAVPADGDPWPALDGPARALITQMAAVRVDQARREGRNLDEVGEELVGACARMTRFSAPGSPGRRVS